MKCIVWGIQSIPIQYLSIVMIILNFIEALNHHVVGQLYFKNIQRTKHTNSLKEREKVCGC